MNSLRSSLIFNLKVFLLKCLPNRVHITDRGFLRDVKEMRKNYVYREEKLPPIPYSYDDYERDSYFE